MPGFFDRLGKAAQQTAAESKLRLDIHNLNSRLADRAQALGMLMFRQNKGEEISEEEYTKILAEMTDLDNQRQAKEAEMEDLHRPAPVASPAPVPTPAPAPTPAPVAAPAGVACACGTVNPPGTRFCPNCGQPVAA